MDKFFECLCCQEVVANTEEHTRANATPDIPHDTFYEFVGICVCGYVFTKDLIEMGSVCARCNRRQDGTRLNEPPRGFNGNPAYPRSEKP